MEWLLIVVLWLLFAIGVGEYATTKGRDATGWFGLSLLFSPLIAFVILAVLQPVAGSQANSTFKKCPFCAETIRSEAKVCRYCGRDLPQPAAHTAPNQRPSVPKTSEDNRNWLIVSVIAAVCVFFVVVAYFGRENRVHENESLTQLLTPDEVISRCGVPVRDKIVDSDPHHTDIAGHRYMFYRARRGLVRFDRLEKNSAWKFGAVQEATESFFSNENAAVGTDALPCLSTD